MESSSRETKTDRSLRPTGQSGQLETVCRGEMALLKTASGLHMHLHACVPKLNTQFSKDLPDSHLGTTFLHGNKGLKQNSDYLPAGFVTTLIFKLLSLQC